MRLLPAFHGICSVEMGVFLTSCPPILDRYTAPIPRIRRPDLRRADQEDEDKDDEKSNTPEPQSSEIAKALYKSRTVLICGEVDMKMAEQVNAQLLAYAESEGDIRVIVNSPGGHVESGDTIHDMIRFVGNKVKMIGTGWVASAGAHIFLGARKEN